MSIFDKIYEDSELIAIDKLTNIPVLPSKTHTNALSKYTSEIFPITKDLPDFGFVHRLDNETKGIMLIAKNIDMYNKLRQYFTEHKIEKTYLARVHGQVKQTEFTVSYPIAHDKRKKKKMLAVKPGYRIYRSKPRNAVSNVYLLNSNKNTSDLKIITKYGVRHQIRVHLASIGFPIIGDKLYGKKDQVSLMLIAKSLKLDIGDKKTFVSRLDLDTIFTKI